jgi:DNA-binding transcriptional ArsR family regulator
MAGSQELTDLRNMLRAMGDGVRLNILHQLAGQGEINVTDLVAALGHSQPLVSWHLHKLRRVGLVRMLRRGREVYCSLDASRFADCLQALSALVAPHGRGTGRDAPLGPVGATSSIGAADLTGAVSPTHRQAGRSRPRAGPATS